MFRSASSIIGKETDAAFLLITGICVLLLAVITFFMLFFLWKYSRGRNTEPQDIEGAAVLEVSLLTGSVLIVLFMFYLGLGGYRKLKKQAPGDAMEVKAVARQWLWTFEYGGGKTAGTLNLPAGRPVRIILESMDVIHGFYIPAFRIKQDAVPGARKEVWFTPDEEGSYDLFCTQYCGAGHYRMITKVNIMNEAGYREWAVAPPGPEAAPGKAEKKPAAAEAGKALYLSKGCSVCHSIDGSRLVGPTFKGLYGSRVKVITGGKEREVTVDGEYIKRSELEPNADIVVGYPPIMPSQRGTLQEDDIKALIEFIKGLD